MAFTTSLRTKLQKMTLATILEEWNRNPLLVLVKINPLFFLKIACKCIMFIFSIMKQCALLLMFCDFMSLVEMITFYPFKCQVHKSRPPRPLCLEPNIWGQQCGKLRFPRPQRAGGILWSYNVQVALAWHVQDPVHRWSSYANTPRAVLAPCCPLTT